MKLGIIELMSLIIFFFVRTNQFSSDSQQDFISLREKYEACIRIRTKSPNFNLKCETLLKSDVQEKNNEKTNDTNLDTQIKISEIKSIKIDKNNLKKVNKKEEMKLRAMIDRLMKENNQKKREIIQDDY